jgi:hypothetical protein
VTGTTISSSQKVWQSYIVLINFNLLFSVWAEKFNNKFD